MERICLVTSEDYKDHGYRLGKSVTQYFTVVHIEMANLLCSTCLKKFDLSAVVLSGM